MRVFNVPSSARFLHTVIEALIDGKLVEDFSARDNPEQLADVTLYLPTRRAARTARGVFLDVLESNAAVLPRIVPLGSVDEDELEFSAAELGDSIALDIPPKLEDLERRLTLAKLIAAWSKAQPDQLIVCNPASALAIADDLARFIDDMVTRGVDWALLDNIVPENLDVYWQHTLKFLKIARETWPPHLREIGKIEPAARRDILIAAEAQRLLTSQGGPVIAAGSTGSMPATAKFLHVIAKHPRGAVILPGLDTHLEENAWQTIGGVRDAEGKLVRSPEWSHPQFAIHHLLADVFGVKREDVEDLAQGSRGREVLASEAMRPAGSTAIWHTRLAEPQIASQISNGMKNLALIEAANPEMEALSIAVAMREARQHNIQTALVTPDRALARRVKAALGRWNLDVDDSGGDSLMDTPAGIFARLVAGVIAEEFPPASLLALLKHPMLRLGAKPCAHKNAIEDLELALLRGTRPPAGTAGLKREFEIFREEIAKLRRNEHSAIHSSEARARLDAPRLDAVEQLIDRLINAFAPLETISRKNSFDFTEIAILHRDVLIALSQDDERHIAVFEEPDGLELAAAFDRLFSNTSDDKIVGSGLLVQVSDYPDAFWTAFFANVVRRPPSESAQLRIYGLLEARLTENTRVILGGLIENVWPPQPRIDPWLSRPMRQELGLDLPERRIGLTAHDFAQLLGAQDVILSHSAKVGGAPAVASRFLHRLKAVAGDELWAKARERGAMYVRWAGELDRPEAIRPVSQPAPKPALDLRPLRMSVTDIEHWLRDPYTIYAKYILKLIPLDPVDMPLTAADRGSAIHEALGEFTAKHRRALPADAEGVLRKFGEKHFAPLMDRPEARALWWPRFLRIVSWFADWETDRRKDVLEIDAETYGRLTIPLGDARKFTLSARADRIEHRRDGTFAILDYKTGQTRTGKQVRLGLAPQLSLEAAILREGGFDGIAPGASVSELMYVRLTGNNPPGKAEKLILALDRNQSDEISADEVAALARMELENRVRLFEDEKQGYTSLSLPMWENVYSDYDDLARIKEWSVVGDGDDE